MSNYEYLGVIFPHYSPGVGGRIVAADYFVERFKLDRSDDPHPLEFIDDERVTESILIPEGGNYYAVVDEIVKRYARKGVTWEIVNTRKVRNRTRRRLK